MRNNIFIGIALLMCGSMIFEMQKLNDFSMPSILDSKTVVKENESVTQEISTESISRIVGEPQTSAMQQVSTESANESETADTQATEPVTEDVTNEETETTKPESGCESIEPSFFDGVKSVQLVTINKKTNDKDVVSKIQNIIESLQLKETDKDKINDVYYGTTSLVFTDGDGNEKNIKIVENKYLIAGDDCYDISGDSNQIEDAVDQIYKLFA